MHPEKNDQNLTNSYSSQNLSTKSSSSSLSTSTSSSSSSSSSASSSSSLSSSSSDEESEIQRKKNKSRKLGNNKKFSKSRNEGGDSDESMLDLREHLKPIGAYIKDREQMLDEMFRCIKGNKLQSMLPDIIKVFFLSFSILKKTYFNNLNENLNIHSYVSLILDK
jgi:hypothetical protein